MGSAASAVTETPEPELYRYALQLQPNERENILEAVQKAEKLQELEVPHEGEEVLCLWTPNEFYRPRGLVQLYGKEWQRARFDRNNGDGTYSFRHHHAVPRQNVRRFPPGMRPPEIAGVTLEQLRRIYAENQEWLDTSRWNPYVRKMQLPTMYDVVPRIIKPATEQTKGSYAELFTQKAVDVFVSHWWGHEFAEFVKALEHAASELVLNELKDREPGSIVFWICSFANAQWTVNLGSSLEASPFERALACHSCKAVVMVMDEQAMPLTRIWCIYEVLRTSVLRLPFYVATRDGVLLGERVQDNPALAQTLLALAEKLLDLQPQEALASNEEDKRMIVDAVSDAVGVPQFALAVQSSLFEILRKAGYALFSKNWALNFRLLQVHRVASREVYWLHDASEGKIPGRRRGGRNGQPPEKRSAFHRAAQEGDRDRLKQLLKEEDMKLKMINDLKTQEQSLRGTVDSYQRRYELQQQIEDLTQHLTVRMDELGQQAIHLAARYSDPETFQTLAQLDGNLLHARDLLGRLPLHRAAESGDPVMVAAVAAFYESQDLSKALDKKQHSCLDLAVLSGSVKAVEAMAASAERASASTKRTPLHLAAQWNHVEVLQTLASTMGFALNACDGDGTQPLHLAARFGHSEAVAMLIGLGANVSAATRFGRTALHWAALNGHVVVAERLIACRCPVDQRDHAGWTPFQWTLRRCHAACSRALMEGSADLMMEDLKNQRNTLHVAACFNIQVELLEEMQEQLPGLSLESCDVAGKTPLHLSAQWGTVDVALKLLELKSDLELRCSHQRTPLYLSARRGNPSVAYELLRRSANLHAADANGVTPIFAAARHDHFQVVMLLLQNNASVTAAEKDGMTVLHWAAKHGNCKALRALVAKTGSNPYTLVAAQTRHGRTPLHLAALSNRLEAVKLLLQLRSDPSVRQKDGWMPIHLAARFGHMKVVEAMLECRCDGDAPGVYGKTAAHCAAERNCLEIYTYGRTALSQLNRFQVDQGGRNVWHLAAAAGHKRLFCLGGLTETNLGKKQILALAMADARGRTPLHLAAAKGQHLVVKAILDCLTDDKGNSYDPRWDKKERFRHYGASDIEDLLNEEPPVCPLLLLDHQKRLPLHLAALQGFPQVTTLLGKFMLQKLDCSVSQLQAPDADGNSPLKLALDRKHWEVVRRLASLLELPEPPELLQLEIQQLQGTPLGSQVRVKDDFTIDSGKMMRKGEAGLLESREDETVTIQFVGERVTQTFGQFAGCCVPEKSFLLNGSTWRRRAKCPFPTLRSRAKAAAEPLALNACDEGDGSAATFSEGEVVRGFDEGRGWLRLLSGAYLPLLLQLDEARVVPALTPWQGPKLRVGQLVRTRGELVMGRTTVPPRSVGLVRRIDESDAATVVFENADRWLRLPGKNFVVDLELLPYVTILEEPRNVPKDGTVALSSKRMECGQVVRQGGGNYCSVIFHLIFPDGSKSITLSDRRGLREIARAPSVTELAHFVRRKEHS